MALQALSPQIGILRVLMQDANSNCANTYLAIQEAWQVHA